jgi:hypothetical protein
MGISYDQSVIVMLDNGGSFPLRPAVSKKSGNRFWTLLGEYKPGGVRQPLSQLGGSLPASFTVNGVTCVFSEGKNKNGAPQVRGVAKFEHDDMKFNCSVVITYFNVNGVEWFNLTSSIFRNGGAKKGQVGVPASFVAL